MRRSPENIATFEQNIFFHIFILFRTGSTDGCRYLVSERSTKEKTPKEQSRAKEINEKKANKKPTCTQYENKGSASERSAKSGKVKSAARLNYLNDISRTEINRNDANRVRSVLSDQPPSQFGKQAFGPPVMNLDTTQRKDDLPQISALTIRPRSPCFDVPRLNKQIRGKGQNRDSSVLNDRQTIASETAESSRSWSLNESGNLEYKVVPQLKQIRGNGQNRASSNSTQKSAIVSFALEGVSHSPRDLTAAVSDHTVHYQQIIPQFAPSVELAELLKNFQELENLVDIYLGKNL